MTIQELITTVAAYHEKDPSDFVKGGVNLILVALNNARKKIEMFNDFNSNRRTVEVTVSPETGGLLSSAVDRETDEEVKVKEFLTFYKVNNGVDVPIEHDTKRSQAIKLKDQAWARGTRYPSTDDRFPDDASTSSWNRSNARQMIYVHGDSIFFNPDISEDTTVAIDVVIWMPPYIASALDTEDWLCEHGAEYLMWAAIVETNYFAESFLPGMDGNLAAPEKLRDAAMQNLVTWDRFQAEAGRTIRPR